MPAAPTTSAVGWPWPVSSPLVRGVGVGAGSFPGRPPVLALEPSCPDLSLPGAGMPTAYDLSSVIAGGSSVGHNNLIPLGEPRGWVCPGPL